MTLRDELGRQCAELGFAGWGIATLEPAGDRLDRWLAAGYGATMRYLHRQARKRNHPAEIEAGAIRAVVVLDNYFPGADEPPPPGVRSVRIAKYARGRDYHLDLVARLDRLAQWLRAQGAAVARSFADAGPVPERELAVRAGLGWIGKNTMLIKPGTGSFFFIGSVFTDLPVEPDRPLDVDHCGTCTRCLEACPTGALTAPRTLDANRCISFLTIESKAGLPEALVPALSGWAFGCDICNDVCPWNERFAAPTSNPAYRDRGEPSRDDPGYFDALSDDEFAARFADTPFERPGLARMRRNYHNAFRSLDS